MNRTRQSHARQAHLHTVARSRLHITTVMVDNTRARNFLDTGRDAKFVAMWKNIYAGTIELAYADVHHVSCNRTDDGCSCSPVHLTFGAKA